MIFVGYLRTQKG